MTAPQDPGSPTDAGGAVEEVRRRVQRLAATVLVGVLPWLIAPGRLQPDTKTDLVVAPSRYLQRALWAWNDHTGIGELQNQAYGYLWPMGTLFLAGDAVGLSGWVTQRLWWTLLLVVAFVGAERLARRVAGLPTVPALVTGAVFALSPRVLTVLAEISVEVWPYALAPWLVLAADRMVGLGSGVVGRRGGAAATGLLTACLGGVNATVSLVALVPAAAWVVLAPAGRQRGRALPWWLLGSGLGALWWLGPLVVLGRYSYPFLDHIEVAATTTAVASVTNVLRGTEHWIAFILTAGDHPTWQSGWVLAQSVTAIIATTVLAGLGLAGLVRRRSEPVTTEDEGGSVHLTRWALVLVLLGAVTMTMGRTGAASGILAEPVQNLLDGPLAPFRNVHKADLLVRLPVAVGVGLLSHWATRVDRGAGPVVRQAVVVTTVLALVGALSPVWQGRVGDAWAPGGIPATWSQTAARVDALAEEDGGTTLVLPGARTADFTWGRVTDEPLRALASSPVLVRAAAPLGHPGATRVLDHVDALAATGRSQPQLAAGLRRMGISRVVVRGGLRADLATVDPRQVAATLEASPGLTRTWSHGEGSEEISIWRLEEPVSPATAVPIDTVVTAAASPDGWFSLVAAGLLDPESVMRQPTADRPAEVRTDTLRWQALNSGRPPAGGSGPTLTAADARPALVGSRALTGPATHGEDATRGWTTRFWTGLSGIATSSSAASPFAPAPGSAGEGAPALVDGDPETAWVSGDGAATQRVTLHLDESASPHEVLVHEAWGGDLGRLVSVTVDGEEGTRPEDSMTWRVPLDGTERDEVTIELSTQPEDDDGDARPVGVREIELGGGPELGTGLELPGGSGPVLLTRDPRAGADLTAGEDPSSLVRRVGQLPRTQISATVRIRPGAAGQDLVAAPWRLHGSTLPDAFASSSDLEHWPVAALDGDPDTRWTPASGVADPVLAIDLGSEQEVGTIRLDRAVGRVTVATDSERHVLPGGTTLTIPRQRTRHLALTFSRPPGLAAWSAPEVSVPGTDGPQEQVRLDCSQAGAVGREDGRIGLSLSAPRQSLIAGEAVPATACGDLPAGDGTVTAVAVPGLVAERVALVPRDWTTPEVTGARTVDSDREHAGSWTLDVGPGERSLLVLTQGANEGWRATADGERLRATTVDGWRQAFVLPEGPATTVSVEFTPNGTHRSALAVGALATVLLLLWGAVELVLHRRGRSVPALPRATPTTPTARPVGPAGPGRGPIVLGVLTAAAVGVIVAGPLGVLTAVVGALVPVRFRAIAVALVLAGAGVGLSVLGVAERQSTGAWVAQALGALTLGVLAAALVRAGVDGPGPAPGAPRGSTTGAPDPD
ncbi:alpha-(1-_3)-arabinofuranosyltransferase family protein [Janibacter cremeus]|uniref:alpha-(1->3)-arabinofuranosyltransferase domain-containing protein n=1 Tax=Janibacter cremeus TaxID=1285192 RepID=UPI0023F8E23C|nr:alpha-(1->3)-arabinofuranosyltransferase family protein [Janibacter cremeus]WEV79208.1 alpha-(1->3)-arabinofuranosyltransferase family protein [Janibacter cremeus]